MPFRKYNLVIWSWMFTLCRFGVPGGFLVHLIFLSFPMRVWVWRGKVLASITKKDLLPVKGTAPNPAVPLPETVKVVCLFSIQVYSFLKKHHHYLMSYPEKACCLSLVEQGTYVCKTIPVRLSFHGVLGFVLLWPGTLKSTVRHVAFPHGAEMIS